MGTKSGQSANEWGFGAPELEICKPRLIPRPLMTDAIPTQLLALHVGRSVVGRPEDSAGQSATTQLGEDCGRHLKLSDVEVVALGFSLDGESVSLLLSTQPQWTLIVSVTPIPLTGDWIHFGGNRPAIRLTTTALSNSAGAWAGDRERLQAAPNSPQCRGQAAPRLPRKTRHYGISHQKLPGSDRCRAARTGSPSPSRGSRDHQPSTSPLLFRVGPSIALFFLFLARVCLCHSSSSYTLLILWSGEFSYMHGNL